MSEDNPYQSPVSDEVAPLEVSIAGLSDAEKRGMLCFVLATALLVAVDLYYWNVGLFMVFGPLVLFFVVASWSMFAGSRESKQSHGLRLFFAGIVGVFSAIAGMIALVMTCSPAVALVGGGFRLHGPANYSPAESVLGTLITFALTSAVAGLIFLLTYVSPQSLRAKKSPDRSA